MFTVSFTFYYWNVKQFILPNLRMGFNLLTYSWLS